MHNVNAIATATSKTATPIIITTPYAPTITSIAMTCIVANGKDTSKTFREWCR